LISEEVSMSTAEASQKTPAFMSETRSQLSAENRFIEVGGDSLVYRRFGNAQADAAPLLCLQHFRGNLDYWDPALVDRLARDREVILLGNRGVGASSGVVPDNVTDMTRDVLRFVDALALQQVDVLGFSLGGYIAKELALLRPRLVRRIVLAGSAPQGATNIHRWTDDVYALGDPRPIEAQPLGSYHPAGICRQRRQRHDDDHREQLPTCPPPAQRPAAGLSRLGSRLPRPIPHALRRPRQRLSQRRLAARSGNAMLEQREPTMEPLDEAVDHVRGSAAGRLIVEYGDYECPYSRQAFREIERVEEQLNGRVRFAFRHFPLTEIHPHASAAAAATEAAALQHRFWNMHELLFHRQMALEDDDLQRYAAQLGLDVARFDHDRASADILGRIRRDVESGMASGEVTGTPTLFIDGVVHLGGYDAATSMESLAR
jgi:pimeloyl-ACP methyl ester carboxylesterase